MSSGGTAPVASSFWLDVGLLRDLRRVAEALEQAHDSLALLDAVMNEEVPYSRRELWSPRLVRPPFETTWPTNARSIWLEEASLALLPSERVHIVRLNISSPGWLEVIGSWNPLETIRKYMQDREERRRNRLFRDRIEEDRGDQQNEALRLENERALNEVLRERVDLLEDLGIPAAERARILNIAVAEPLSQLGELADQGLLRLEAPLPDDGGNENHGEHT